MVVTEEWAKLVAPDAPWVEAVRTALGPVKSAIINSHPSVSSFFDRVDVYANTLLEFYAPEMPPEARRNSDLPLMDGKDALMYITGYLLVVLLSLLFLKGNTPEQAQAQRNQKTIASKLGPVFLFQAVYNIAQVLACGFVVLRVLDVLQMEQYSMLCNNFNVADSRMRQVTWFFYMLKYVDLLDTAFMILRGNLRQVTFLHVFHHSSVIYIFWVNASVGYDGEIYFVVLLNAFVHVVMYAYYFMASFNIPLARMVKSCVTQLQMIQFLAMVAHGIYHICFHQSCHYPVRITTGYLVYVVSLFFLFKDFSNKTYKKKNEIQKQKSA